MAAASGSNQHDPRAAGGDRTGGHSGAGSTGIASKGGRHARERTGRRAFHWPHRRRKDGPGAAVAPEATYHRNGEKLPTGLGASLVTSGSLLLAMVEDVRMRGVVEPEELRPLADSFARHSAAKEATVRKVLTRRNIAVDVVERDRQEGDLIQGILDKALTGRHPDETRTLTIDGALAQMYQYLFHERRDLVPAIEQAMSPEDSESLAAAFEAISAG
ncbi:hypothetical protein GA0115240_15254 [Streptomyces sp. DvalAA-14]|uniref:hypothetical protein n=1 Tax=unclassified Streptomyces TaxID=2593676 RepID=UPI00081B5DBA|nr:MULTISPECIES: hypothetical protein [unclassified Streptomyces]MYS23449.1 hypothetical protein [Streptomyces sp. SID4948]SCE33442.1 hypothetical protein GA0115240_15254 [Streptomyces sp. DvalAA-14]